MDYTIDEVIDYIEDEDAKFIRLAFRDAYGVEKNIAVMPGEIGKAFKDGVAINAREIAGFEECPYPFLFLKPDPTTLSVLPWRPDSGRVLRMFCDVVTPDGEPYVADTRHILKKAVAKAKEAGITFKFGTETEFYLFKKDDEGYPTKIPYDNAGYLDIAPADRCENVRREICLTIEQMGLTPERSHHERGPGQNEVDFHYGKPLLAADQMTTFRMVVSILADRIGLVSDFSPLPMPNQPGNGYLINVYAEDREGNDVVQYAAAGIFRRIKEMTIFLNPTDASYSRFGRNTAPDRINWSNEGGSELMFVETTNGRTHAALRSPDASGNPYLMYALLIYAGLEGIENHMELPDEVIGEEDLLPSSRKEAAKFALASDFIRRTVPQGILNVYAKN